MIRLNVVLSLSALVFASSVLGCSKPPEPQADEKKAAPPPAPPPAPSATASSTSANTIEHSGVADVAYEVPKKWEVVPNTNQMRKATIRVPKQPGDPEDGELTVSDAMGSIDANVARWCNQFGQTAPAKKEQRTVNGVTMTIVEVKGPYAGMGGPKKDGYMLLGAIVPGTGAHLHFFKLTGPEKTVTAARPDFDAFVATFRAK